MRLLLAIVLTVVAVGLHILLLPGMVHIEQDRRVLKSSSGYQTVSMLDGGRTGLYYDVGEEAGRLRPNAKRVVLLGMGGGEMLRAARRSLPTAELVGVEVDPHTAGIAISDFGVLGFGVKVVVEDAFHYVAGEDDVDILLVDVFNDATIPRLFLDPLFAKNCHRAMRPDGLLVWNVYPASLAPDVALLLYGGGFRKVWKRGLIEGNVLIFAEP